MPRKKRNHENSSQDPKERPLKKLNTDITKVVKSKLKSNEVKLKNSASNSQLPLNNKPVNDLTDDETHLTDMEDNVSVTSKKDPVNVTMNVLKQQKPIFVEINLKELIEYFKGKKFTQQPIYTQKNIYEGRKVKVERVKIQTFNHEDKDKVIKLLKDKAYRHHTFTESELKSQSFLLKNYIKDEPKTILEDLNAIGIGAISVKIFKNPVDSVIYLVSFKDPSLNIVSINKKFPVVNFVKIKWEIIKKKFKNDTQCFNCQEWGHAAANCGNPYRCVACKIPHGPKECPRKHLSQEVKKESPAVCCNCQGNHAANFKQCPAFKTYKDTIKMHKAKITRTSQWVKNPMNQTVNDANLRLDSIEKSFPRLDPRSRAEDRSLIEKFNKVEQSETPFFSQQYRNAVTGNQPTSCASCSSLSKVIDNLINKINEQMTFIKILTDKVVLLSSPSTS
jgi:hypothetical protein